MVLAPAPSKTSEKQNSSAQLNLHLISVTLERVTDSEPDCTDSASRAKEWVTAKGTEQFFAAMGIEMAGEELDGHEAEGTAS